MDYSTLKEHTFRECGAGGLVLARRPWELEDDEWQDCQNVQFVAGAVRRTPGFSSFGIPAAGVRVVSGYGYKDGDSTTVHGYVVVTANRIYKKTRTAGGTLDANWVDLSRANFANVISGVLPNETNPDVGFDLYRTSLYIAPGDNAVQFFNGATLATLGGSPPNCRDFMVYGERGLAARLRTGAPASQGEFRWSDAGNLATGWAAANNAKAERLPSVALKFKRTGQYVFCYKADGIERILITPDSVKPFRTDIVHDGIGLAGTHGSNTGGVVSYYADDFFVGQSGIYRFSGGRLEDIGRGVFTPVIGDLMMSAVGLLAGEKPQHVRAYADLDEILFSNNLTYNPKWATWGKRVLGEDLSFVATGWHNIPLVGRFDSNLSMASMFSFATTRNDEVYIQDANNLSVPSEWVSAGAANSNVVSKWFDMGTRRMKRWTRHVIDFDRQAGTTMTIEYRTFNSTHENPAGSTNADRYKSVSFVCSGAAQKIDLNLTGRFLEFKPINNSNGAFWRFLNHTLVWQEFEWD